MAPFRTTVVNGTTVFAQSASFVSDWNTTNETAGWPGSKIVYTGYPIIYDSGIHPADVITRSSEPDLLQVARNTIWTDGKNVKWNPVNGFVLSWIPAARIVERENASELLDGFEAAVNVSVYTNWCAKLSVVGALRTAPPHAQQMQLNKSSAGTIPTVVGGTRTLEQSKQSIQCCSCPTRVGVA